MTTQNTSTSTPVIEKKETESSAPQKTSDSLAQQREALEKERERLKEIAAKTAASKQTNSTAPVKTVILKDRHSMQTGMPGRPELTVTINFKQGQTVTDPATIKLLEENNAPIEHV